MEITLTEIGPSHKSIKFSKSIEDVKKDYNAKISEVNRNVSVPGFRPGKTPRRIVEKRYSSSILDELKRNYLVEGFEQLTKKENIRPIEEPNIDPEKIELEKDKEFVFEIDMEIHPEISLKDEDYKALKASRDEVFISDEELNNTLDRIREQKAEWVPLEKGKAEEKDIVMCDVSMHAQKKELYSEDNMSVHLERPYILGIDIDKDDFIGKSVGDLLEKKVTIPDSFEAEEHRGKKVTLKAKIVELKRKELPELNDEFAKELQVENLEALKADLTKEMTSQKEKEIDQKIEHDLIHQLQHNLEIVIPENFLKKNIDAAVEEEKKKAADNKEDKKEKEVDVEKVTKTVVHDLKEIFLMNYIAEQQKIEISRNEINDYINNVMFSQGGVPPQMQQMFKQQGVIDEIYVQLKNQKVLAFLRENATVEIKKEEKKANKKTNSEKNKKTSNKKTNAEKGKKANNKKKK